MNSAMYVMEKNKIVRACSYNQKRNTKNICTCELLVCKFQARKNV